MSNLAIEYIILGITLLITLGAQGYINSCYGQTKRLRNKKNMSGAETARMILDTNGLSNVKVVETTGMLSDHYDPRSKVVRLSPDIYTNPSIAAVSVAAHECGHAIQDKEGYVFLRIRSSIAPIVNLASIAGYIAIFVGIFTMALNLIWLGIIFELVILFFQLITLPVEINASSRALKQIEKLHILDNEERKNSKKMLTAAALTYVAAVATSLLEIVRLVLIFTRNDD